MDNPSITNGAAGPQANVTNNQTYNIDITQFYNDIITAIDRVRSHVSVSQSQTAFTTFLQSLSNNSTTNDPSAWIKQLNTDPNNPQETRCHAFYRLLGLPVIAPDGSLYSPGFDHNANTQADPNAAKQKANVINKLAASGLFAVMNAREVNVKNFLSIFSRSNQNSGFPDINATALALSSVANGTVRQFSASLVHSKDPFDTVVGNQAYNVGSWWTNGQVLNTTGLANLAAYLGPDGNPPSVSVLNSNNILSSSNPNVSMLTRRAHVLKPFMVDPRVDVSVNPPNGLVCAPFPDDKSKTLYAQDIYLPRPYIETICRARCNAYQNQSNPSSSQGTNSPAYQDLTSFISNTNSLKNQDLLTILANASNQNTTSQVLFKYVNIMNSMVIALNDALTHIQTAEINHQWIPMPSTQGPEGGSTTANIYLIPGTNGASLDPIITTNYILDQDIVTFQAQIALQNINANVPTVDLGNFAFQGIDTTPDDNSTQSFGSQTQEHLDQILSQRNAACANAATALQTVEIIMGEFSGFGLCDILALFTALWTVDETTLINMLDNHAFARLYNDPTLRDPIVEERNSFGSPTVSGTVVLQNFETQVKQMYALMDKLYKNVTTHNTTSS